MALKKAVLIIAWFLITIALLFTSLQICMNDRNWYAKSYSEYGISEEIGISVDDMTDAIMRLVDYMEGRVGSIQLTVTEFGTEVEMYNEREMAHMEDVRNLYQFWKSFRGFAAAFGIGCATAVLILGVKKENRIEFASSTFIFSSAVFAAILAALGAWVIIDFNGFWISFHHLFFTNDLWLLDYYTDRMIRICPEELFNDIVVRFALIFLIPFITALAASIAGMISKRKKKTK